MLIPVYKKLVDLTEIDAFFFLGFFFFLCYQTLKWSWKLGLYLYLSSQENRPRTQYKIVAS